MFTRFSKLSLTKQVVIAMALGATLGLLLNHLPDDSFWNVYLSKGVFEMGGKIFVRCLMMLVVPLVFVSLVCGTASLSDVRQLGRIGGKTMAFYVLTTIPALVLAITCTLFVGPGIGFDLSSSAIFSVENTPGISEVIIDIFPDNPFKAMASNATMLQVIFFSIFFGLAMTLVGDKSARLKGVFDDANEVIMRMITLLMMVAPYGVFCLIAQVFAQQGFTAIAPLIKYFFVVLGVLALHCFITYPCMLTLLSRLNPITFFRKFRQVMIFAFSTSSSNATIPVTLDTVEHRLGVSNTVASFSIPLGSTINMDGTSIMQGVATVFISQAYNIDLSLTDYLMVVFTATLATIGTAGVPGVGLITLAMVLRQVGLPEEGIGLIIGVDRLLDMARTAVNVTGDGVVSCIVAKSEGELDLDIYHDFSKFDKQ